jgi:ubiquinol-cytochrome c reductase iron-sulfur subunit
VNQLESHDSNPHRPQLAPIPHELRRTDVDARAAKRAERQVAAMFAGSALMAMLFVVSFVLVDPTYRIGLPVIGTTFLLNVLMGVTFGISIFLIGAGAIHWAKKLMPDSEVIEERHSLESSDEDKAALAATFDAGVGESGIKEHSIIRRSLLGALAVFPIPVVFMLRDLGPGPGDTKFNTMWTEGLRLLRDVTYEPIKADEIPIGALINAVPEGLEEVEHETGNLNARAKAVIIVVRIAPDQIVSQQGGTPDEPWDFNGVLAYSKVCTHVGCPISLYEQKTHHLLCPCHQSTYDLADSGRVIFGPASRRMPQLAITVDSEGYLIARGDFAEPIGPSFWEI